MQWKSVCSQVKLIKANILHCWILSGFRLWCFVTAVFIFRLSSQFKHSDAAEADAAASTEDSTSAEPAATHTAPETFPAAAVSQSTL